MMQGSLHKYHRRSIRYAGYDYTQPGAYFVTMVAYHRNCIFGGVIDGQVGLNKYGLIVASSWEWLARQYHYIENSTFVVMPNHIHGILQIIDTNNYCRGGSRPAPTEKIKPLGQLLGAFKTTSAKQINLLRSQPGSPVWQRNFYEHIIRNEHELDKISVYILSNPQTWAEDPEYLA